MLAVGDTDVRAERGVTPRDPRRLRPSSGQQPAEGADLLGHFLGGRQVLGDATMLEQGIGLKAGQIKRRLQLPPPRLRGPANSGRNRLSGRSCSALESEAFRSVRNFPWQLPTPIRISPAQPMAKPSLRVLGTPSSILQRSSIFTAGLPRRFCGSTQIFCQPRSMRRLPTSTITTTAPWLPLKPGELGPSGLAGQSRSPVMSFSGVVPRPIAVTGDLAYAAAPNLVPAEPCTKTTAPQPFPAPPHPPIFPEIPGFSAHQPLSDLFLDPRPNPCKLREIALF